MRRHLACRRRRKRQLSEVASPGVTGDASMAGTGRVSRASSGGRLARHYREAEGLSIGADRRSLGSLLGDGEGVLLRPDRREGAGSQGPLCRGLSRLRRVHAAAQTGRATRTRTARRATPARSSAAGPAKACSRRCVTGWTAAASCRRRTTGGRHGDSVTTGPPSGVPAKHQQRGDQSADRYGLELARDS